MGTVFNRMKGFMFGDQYEDEDYEEEDGYMEEEDTYMPRSGRTAQTHIREVYAEPNHESQKNTRNTRTTRGNQNNVYHLNANAQMQVVIMYPEAYEDAQDICDQLKERHPVVINLEKVEYPTAQRIMDFLSGTCYSLDGAIQRISNNTFVIAPANVEINGKIKEELKTKGINLPWMATVEKGR